MTSRQARKIDSRQKSCVLIDFTSDRIFRSETFSLFFFSFLKKETKSFEQSGVFHRMFRKEENLSHSSSLESNKITSFRFARLKMDLKKTRLSKNNN